MKKIIIFAFVVVIGCANAATIEEQWEQYKVNFNRNYNEEENLKRFELFKKKVQEIEEHNAKFDKGEVSFSMGINQFTDRTLEELNYGGLVKPEPNTNEEDDLLKQWQDFKVKHKRNFDEAEDAERFEIFKANVKKINEHNEQFKKGQVSFSMGVNQFSDRKPEEKGQYLGVKKP